MKISKLIATHHAIIEQARLANLAQAYLTLQRVAERVNRAQLCGLVNLRQPDADEGRLWATLTALEGRQSVLEEHFNDEDIMEIADAVAFVRGVACLDIMFRLEAMMAEFLVPLEAELKHAGVELDFDAGKSGSWKSGSPRHVPDHRRGGTPNQR